MSPLSLLEEIGELREGARGVADGPDWGGGRGFGRRWHWWTIDERREDLTEMSLFLNQRCPRITFQRVKCKLI